MSKLKFLRKVVTEDTIEEFEFDVRGFEFLVKNFSEYDIFVSIDDEESKNNMMKIPANCSQIITASKQTSDVKLASKDVYVLCEDGDAEVEIQLIL